MGSKLCEVMLTETGSELRKRSQLLWYVSPIMSHIGVTMVIQITRVSGFEESAPVRKLKKQKLKSNKSRISKDMEDIEAPFWVETNWKQPSLEKKCNFVFHVQTETDDRVIPVNIDCVVEIQHLISHSWVLCK